GQEGGRRVLVAVCAGDSHRAAEFWDELVKKVSPVRHLDSVHCIGHCTYRIALAGRSVSTVGNGCHERQGEDGRTHCDGICCCVWYSKNRAMQETLVNQNIKG